MSGVTRALSASRLLWQGRMVTLLLRSTGVTGATSSWERNLYCLPTSFATTVNEPRLLSNNRLPQVTSIRGKKKGKQKKVDERSDDEEEGEEEDYASDDEVVGAGYMDRTINVNSLRLDTIIKFATNIPRKTVDEMFLDGRIRVNGERVSKKSDYVNHLDEIDAILGRNRDNSDFLDVSRTEILAIPDIATGTGRMKVKVRVYKCLTVPNYDNDPHTGLIINEKRGDDISKDNK